MIGLKQALAIMVAIVLLVACRNGQDKQGEEDSHTPTAEIVGSESNDPLSTVSEAASETGPQKGFETGPQTGFETGSQTGSPPGSESSDSGQDLDQAPETKTDETPAQPEEVIVEAADGLSLVSTFYPGAGQGPRPGVILLHMNGRQRQDWDAFGRMLAEQGYAALTTDMRGHGETGGQRDWDLAADDLLRIRDYFIGREEVDESRTAVVGASIGANMALVIGEEIPDIQGVALLSPGRDYFGVTTEDRVLEYGERPLLLVASEEDTESAITARSLSELALGDVQLEMNEGAGHGTNIFAARPELSEVIIDWLDQHVGDRDQLESAGQDAGLPAPSLFDLSWDDRAIFRDGLVTAEAGVLDQLPGAPLYHMDLAISPDLLSVAGRLESLYTNQEDADLDEIYFHLYPNLLGGRTSISALTVSGHRVDPEYRFNQSVLRVPLDSPLAPGEQAVIAMEFLVDVPSEGGSNYGVFATIDEVMALAHFFPQIAVYDDQGWNIDVPPPNADVTYADTAFYVVRVTAPAEQVLVASGIEVDRQDFGDSQVTTFAAGPVRDFYMASSDGYTVTSRQVGETTINSYGFPEFAEHNTLALVYAAGAMESFNERFGLYPFTEFDIAPTPNLALAVEYPGAVVIRSALYSPLATLGDVPATVYLEGSVAHEVGHQWFYGVLGNDQIDEPWLDESLTQHVTYLYFVDTYGEENAEPFRQSFHGRWDRVDRADIPVGLPAGDYSGAEYGAIVYGRGPLFFDALKAEMGEQVFDAFLRDYYQQNKWGIATGREFKALAEQHCSCDLTPLFAQWIGDL
ncbi:MAG: alpha/beta fold hydrolase [Candidatus Promineifilaceae bacterium]